MKKIIAIFVLIACIGLISCSNQTVMKQEDIDSNSNSITSMFVEVEHCALWKVVYHRDTKVMYAVSDGDYNHGTFTLLVNADGSPMVYGGNE